jgi:8-oxo-dGTP diphosphatase
MSVEKDINLHIVFVTAWIKKGDRYLLAKRASHDAQAAGLWSTPGGKVDLDLGLNVVEDTLRREIKEEVGVEVKDRINYLGSDSFIRESGHHVVALTFLVEYKSGEAKPLEDQEEIRWLSMEQIQNLIKGDKRIAYLGLRLKLLRNFMMT